jgi:two-component system, NarL family, nitrate/nitrite response regulator NarL
LLVAFLDSQPDLDVAAICESTHEALRAALAEPIDVLVLNHRLTAQIQFDFIAPFDDSPATPRVIVLASCVTDDEAVRLAWSGVAGIFLTSGAADLLLKCVRKVVAGECWFDQKILQAILRQAATLSASSLKDPDKAITKREEQVLMFVLEGLSNKEIATQMDLRETSVKGILQGLFHKNNVRSRSQLVRVAMERRLVALSATVD